MENDIKKIYKARMNKKTFETVKNLHMNWYIHAVKALFGQIGKQLFQQLTKGIFFEEHAHKMQQEEVLGRLHKIYGTCHGECWVEPESVKKMVYKEFQNRVFLLSQDNFCQI